MTVHKLQGQTLDKCVVFLDDMDDFCGQLYVALSRVRSLDGLIISHRDKRKLPSGYITSLALVDPKVKERYGKYSELSRAVPDSEFDPIRELKLLRSKQTLSELDSNSRVCGRCPELEAAARRRYSAYVTHRNRNII